MPEFVPAHAARAPFLNALMGYFDGKYGEADIHVGDHVEVYDRGWENEVVVDIVDGHVVVEVDGQRETLGPDEYPHVVSSPIPEALWEAHQQAPQPDGVAWGDGLVPAALERQLSALFDALCTRPADYHPGTGQALRDLVHPSLYPYIAGRSDLAPGAAPASTVEQPAVDRWGRPFEGSRYQWLPAEVEVDPAGKFCFASPINNLDEAAHPGASALLAQVLDVALPLLESVYGYAQAFDPWDHRAPDCEADLPQASATSSAPEPVPPASLRGRRLQVVPKLVQYEIDAESDFEGVWHVEGMSHEHVVATVLFVLDRDEGLQGGTLHFRRGYTREEAGQVFWNIPQCRPNSVDELIGRAVLPLGTVETPARRMVVFPNSHVHKLSPLHSPGGEKVRRRIVVFWLVDPERRILSTADVLPQQGVLPHEEALAHRLALMEERRLHKQSHNLREISLCEH
jgi:Protein of unknown function (DUF4246)